MPSPPVGFIADGYTRCERIAGCAFHPPLAFEYRPMLSLDRAAFLRRITQLAPEGIVGMVAAEHATAHELARRLVSWTLTDHTGALVEISEQDMMRVEPHLLARIASIILGLTVGDAEREAGHEKN